MDRALASFLAGRSPVVTETVEWNTRFRFLVATYLGAATPPLAFVTSVRSVVLREDLVLVQRDRDSLHILPGGRREDGEPPTLTLAREVREETGWVLRSASLLGFMHFHHLIPRLPYYPYPHPDFVQLVYAARAATFSAEAKLADGYEVASDFRPVAAVRELGLTQRELIFLIAALRPDEPTT